MFNPNVLGGPTNLGLILFPELFWEPTLKYTVLEKAGGPPLSRTPKFRVDPQNSSGKRISPKLSGRPKSLGLKI